MKRGDVVVQIISTRFHGQVVEYSDFFPTAFELYFIVNFGLIRGKFLSNSNFMLDINVILMNLSLRLSFGVLNTYYPIMFITYLV